MPAHANDRPLVDASLRGDAEAFTRLIERHQGLVCAVTLAATCDPSASEDLAQETFITAWRSLPELRDPGSFRAWLCGIARNLSRGMQRRRGRETSLEHENTVPDESPPADEALAAAQSEALVWRVLAEIPDSYREPLILYYREGHSAQAIAERLGMSVAAVEQRLSRGRKYLRGAVEDRIENALTRSRPSSRLTAAIVAALPPAPAGLTASTPLAAVTSTTKGATMLKLIAGTTAITAALSGATLCSSDEANEPDADRGERASMHTADQRSGAAGEQTSLERLALSEARTAARRDEATVDASARYELTRLGPEQVAVELGGGPSTLVSGEDFFGLPEPAPVPLARTIRGRVLDANGQPVEAAVVVGGERVVTSPIAATLLGQFGAVSNPTGAYELGSTHGDDFVLVALHREAGWSNVHVVEGGSADARLDLELGPPGVLEGVVTQAGEPVLAHAFVRSLELEDRFSLTLETDPTGRFDVAALPPGRYAVVAAAGRFLDRGFVARHETRTTEIGAGERARVEIDLSNGGMLLASARWPAEWTVTTVGYYWMRGRHDVASVAEAKALAEGLGVGEHGRLAVGGSDREESVQFADLPEGDLTVCVHAEDLRESVAFECRHVSVESSTQTQEIEIVFPGAGTR